MSFYDAIRVGASAAADYEVVRSIRNDQGSSDVNSGSNFSRTFGSSGNRRTFTKSVWVKKCNTPGNIGDDQYSIISAGGGGSGSSALNLRFSNQDRLSYGGGIGGSSSFDLDTNRLFRDTSAWYHIVAAVDTTQSTASNRVKLYINGVQETSFETATYPTQNYELYFNFDINHRIGSNSIWSNLSNTYGNFNGYIAEFNFIDGLQLDPSSFGATDVITGQWNPKKYVGSYGTNGFYLNFSDNSGTSATTLGKDSSGNGNNFTPNNFSVAAGEGNDSVEDTPTNNFCTLNALDKAAAITFKNGNLQVDDTSTGNYNGFRGTFGSKTGKYYWEIKFPSTGYLDAIGIARTDGRIDTGNQPTYRIVLGLGSWYNSYNSGGVATYVNATPSGDYPSVATWSGASNYSNNDVYMIAVDFGAGKIWWGKNNSWFNNSGTANPATGTDPRVTFTTGNEWFPYSQSGDSSTSPQAYNFGQQGFAYTPPSGFVALNSANLPDPTILLPNKHFAAFTYTGSGSSGDVVNITNSDVDFTPDWVWVKSRATTNNHILTDAVRGGTKYLNSASQGAEVTDTDTVRDFLQGGFESGTDGDTNWPSRTFVAWNWNAGDTDGKTYTVKVVSDSGNKYRFNNFGTSAVTLDLAEGGTYTFDGSDSSMSGHPFVIGTAANGTVYSTGVTYQLDGVSVTYSAYTSGYASASTRKLIITVPASAPVLYYWCSIHSGMGGQINTNSTLGSSNFAGSIQSTAKVNASSGFSIIGYTGINGAGTIGHGLGVAPKAVIVRRRDSASDWAIYHGEIGNTKRLVLNSTAGESNASASWWNNTSPTSTTISLGSDAGTGGSTDKYIVYAFSEVAGYSKFGKYTGNGSDDGVFLFLGFKPAWFMVKMTSGSEDWPMYDNKRDPFNVGDHRIFANTSGAEGAVGQEHFDFVSNGIKFRKNKNPFNTSGSTYIYFAFAEAPFKNARAR